MNNYIIISSLIGVVILTGFLAFQFTDRIKAKSKYVNTFSASVVAALIFVHILPEIYEVRSFGIGFCLLAGMIFQLILEKITNGIEHGHVHSHSKNHSSILLGLLIGLGIHSFVEGTPILLGSSSVDAVNEVATHAHHHHHHDHNQSFVGSKFVTAILLHKVPVTIVLSLFLLSIGVKKIKYFAIIIGFALMTPIGGWCGLLLSEMDDFNYYSSYFVAFSTGMLMHIITAILFEHSHNKKESDAHILIISAGVCVGSLLFYFS